MRCIFARLNRFTAAPYAALTFRAYRATIESCGAGTGVVAVGASVQGVPVGLALGECPPDAPARILSLYVAASFRRRGVGRRLIRRLERGLAAEGARRAELRYVVGSPVAPALERLFHTCGWFETGDHLHIFTAGARILSAPGLAGARLPPSCAVAPWATVSDDERRTLEGSLRPDGWIPPNLAPSRWEKDLEPVNSLVLRRDGCVIGWVLTRRVDSSTIRYANLWVRPSMNRVEGTFLSLALVAEAVRRQKSALGRSSTGRFEVAPGNVRFLRFIDRHLGPYLSSRAVRRCLIKDLQPAHARLGLPMGADSMHA